MPNKEWWREEFYKNFGYLRTQPNMMDEWVFDGIPKFIHSIREKDKEELIKIITIIDREERRQAFNKYYSK